MRSFVIPTSGALAILTTTACFPDPIFGDWEGTSWQVGENQFDLPYSYNDGYFQLEFEVELEIDKDTLEGEIELDQSVTSPADFYDLSESYEFDITKISRGQWTVEIDDFANLELDCVAEKDTLECEGEDEEDVEYELEFERKD